MRMIRSIVFGGLAVLATAIVMSAPASAFDLGPAVITASATQVSNSAIFDDALLVAGDEAIRIDAGMLVDADRLARREFQAMPIARSARTVAVNWAHLPGAYRRIDPHIRVG